MPTGEQELGGKWTNSLAIEIEESLDEIIDELIDLQFVDGHPPLTEKLTLEDLLEMPSQEAILEFQMMLMDPNEQAEGVRMFADWLEVKTGIRQAAADTQYAGG